MDPTGMHAPQIDGDPRDDEYGGKNEIGGTAEKGADALDCQLDAGHPRLLAVVEFRQQFEVFLGRGGQFRRLLGGVFEVSFHTACD